MNIMNIICGLGHQPLRTLVDGIRIHTLLLGFQHKGESAFILESKAVKCIVFT